MTSRVLITGANGFIGSRLCAMLAETGYRVRGTVRARYNTDVKNPAVECVIIGPIEKIKDWTPVLEDIDVVIHLAAVPDIHEHADDDLLRHLEAVNVKATKSLAGAVAEKKDCRFIFLSSIKVNGETTTGRPPFTYADTPQPRTAYGYSKHEAEKVLRVIAQQTGMQLVIIRPCLVYGPEPRGNMQKLLRLIQKGLPLPFGLIDNKRSMLALENLCRLVQICISHPDASGQTFLAADDGVISTPDLSRYLSEMMGKKLRLLPVPVPFLHLAGAIIQKSPMIQRLTSSLQVDTTHTKNTLSWLPNMTRHEALKAMVNSFVKTDGSGQAGEEQ